MMWYPSENGHKKTGRPHATKLECPCCNGTGTRKDAKTGFPRKCVACMGEGKIKNYKRFQDESEDE